LFSLTSKTFFRQSWHSELQPVGLGGACPIYHLFSIPILGSLPIAQPNNETSFMA